MGIQIKGSNDTISADDGSIVLEGATLTFTNENITGISTMASAQVTGNLDIVDKIRHIGDTDTAITFADANTISAETAGSEWIRIDSGGRFLVGNTASQEVYGTNKLQIQGTSATTSGMSLLRHGGSPYLVLGSSGGSSLNAVTALSSGNRIGQLTFAGADGTDINTHSASIAAYVDGSVSSNAVPGRIVFKTSTGATEVERLRIDSNGYLSFAGDTNTYIHHPSSDQLAITLAGASFPVVRFGTGGGGSTVGFSTTINMVTNSEKISVRGYSSFKSVNKDYAAVYVGSEGNTNGASNMLIGFHDGTANRGAIGYTKNTGELRFNNQYYITFTTGAASLGGTERLRITSGGGVSISSDGTIHGVSKLTILPANRTSAFSASDGDTWHDLVLKQTGSATNNAVGIAFETSTSGYHKNAGTGIAAVKNGTNSDYGSDLVFITRGQSTAATEKLRIKDGGQVQLPINGQQLTWGHTQQMKFYFEHSEGRMYLQGDGAYGFAFRINSGNRIEIDKTTGDVTMQGASGRNFQWDNSDASLLLTDNGTNSARLKIGSSGDLQFYHDVGSHYNYMTCATNAHLKVSTNTLQVYEYTGSTKKFETTNRGKVLSYHADTAVYGASNWARTGSGNQSNATQASPEGSVQWQSSTGNGNMRYKAYIQATPANSLDMYIHLNNSGFYRITIEASHNSQGANVAMYLVYGLNNMSAVIQQVTSSGNFSATTQNTHVNSHDTTLKITYSGSSNQGMRALVEQIGGF